MAIRVLPVRVFAVRAGTGVDDPNARTLVTCRRAEDAQALVTLLERIKRSGGFIPADTLEYFEAITDTDINLGTTVAGAIEQGYAVRSVVITTADLANIPPDQVLATIAGATVDDPTAGGT